MRYVLRNFWHFFPILYAAMFGFTVAIEQAAGILSQVRISGPVKCVMGETSELQLLIIHDLSPKINTTDQD